MGNKGKNFFAFVEDKYNRKCTKLEPICGPTLMKYMAPLL